MKFTSLSQIRERVDSWSKKKRFEKDEQETLSNLAASLKIVCDRAFHSVNDVSALMGSLSLESSTSTSADCPKVDLINAPDTRTQTLSTTRHFNSGIVPSSRTFNGNDELREKQVNDIRRISDVVEEINGYMVEWKLSGVRRFQILSILILYCIDLMNGLEDFANDVLTCFNQMK